jgi:hypothetical protein
MNFARQCGTGRLSEAQRNAWCGRPCESKKIAIRIRAVDIERARELAEKKGIGYQTYMKMLLHEALEREIQRAGKAIAFKVYDVRRSLLSWWE